MAEVIIPYFSIGTLVKVNQQFLDEPYGVIAYVYEHYKNGGISLITQNGVDLGGFNTQEQANYLKFYKDTGLIYRFENVTQLIIDWNNGVFKDIFRNL